MGYFNTKSFYGRRLVHSSTYVDICIKKIVLRPYFFRQLRASYFDLNPNEATIRCTIAHFVSAGYKKNYVSHNKR